MDAVDPTQRTDALRRPRLALAGAHAHAIERRGDVLVGPARRHAAHHRQRLVRRAAAVLAGPGLPDTEFRVLAASPVDHQDHLTRGLVHVGDDVLDQGADQPLAGAGGGAGRVPGGREILGEPGEVRRIGGRGRRLGRHPAAPGMPRPAAAPPPSSAPAGRRSAGCPGRRPRSAARRATPRSGPAATRARTCGAAPSQPPCSTSPPRMPPRSPSAPARAGARRPPQHRCGCRQSRGSAAGRATGSGGRSGRPAAGCLVRYRRRAADGRSARSG